MIDSGDSDARAVADEPSPCHQPPSIDLAVIEQVRQSLATAIGERRSSFQSREKHFNPHDAGEADLVGEDSHIDVVVAGDEAVLSHGAEQRSPIEEEPLAVSLEDLVAMLETSQESILAGLSEISDEALRAPAPSGKEGETVETGLAGLVFHEAYHVGETGILRRLLGHEGAIQ